MKKIVDKTVTLSLKGFKGSYTRLLLEFIEQARSEGWFYEEVRLVLDEAISGDLDHLLATIKNHCTEPNQK
jgi:hypothetical protein